MDQVKEYSSPSVEVCMASYNGKDHIKQQLESIYAQTKVVDCVIISDDASCDETISMLKEMRRGDTLIVSNELNLGHVGNFERALSNSACDIIFLSDQDDVWLPGKVEIVMDIFYRNPDIALVHHNLDKVDVNGELIEGRYLNISKGLQLSSSFVLRELLKPRLFGCAMAFRRSVLDVLLPFPKCVYAHDHWVAVAAACVGKVYFLDESLVFHRQHVHNLTPKSRRSIQEILRSRFLFLEMIFHALIRSRSRRKLRISEK